MRELGKRARSNPELKELVAEASRALGAPGYGTAGGAGALVPGAEPGAEPEERGGAKATGAAGAGGGGRYGGVCRVLDATRANLNVMNRLRELRMGRLEYSERHEAAGTGSHRGRRRWGEDAEAGHGDH